MAGPPPSRSSSRGQTSLQNAPWVHLSAAGIEIGSETPTGRASNPLWALISAFSLTWSVREILWVLVVKDFKARYRAQALGLFWSFAHPLVMMITITIAFKYVLKVQIENFQIFYLIGSVIWQFFSNSVLATTGSMIDNAGLVKRTTFPRFLFPVAAILSHLIHFGLEMLLVFAFFFVFPQAYVFNSSLFALPLLILLLLVMLTGVGLTTSGLNVRYRDVYYLVTSTLTVAFWLTPVLFRIDMAPGWLRPLLRANPVAGVIEGARNVIMLGEWPSPSEIAPGAVSGLVMFFVGCAVFRRQNLHIADYV
jgi:ABC-type polysaccharide/polyol phosphate export permease